MSSDSNSTSTGRLLIIVGPSGVGKSSIVHRLLETPGRELSVSCTTRPKRRGERDLVDYRYIDKEEFETLIAKDGFAEYAEVHGNYYGTMREPLDTALRDGTTFILDIDVQGADQIRTKYPDAMSVFILPPNLEELESRLRGRNTDEDAVIQRRLVRAREEIARKDDYDHCVVNDELERAVAEIERILAA